MSGQKFDFAQFDFNNNYQLTWEITRVLIVYTNISTITDIEISTQLW